MKKDIALIAFMALFAVGLFVYSRTLPDIPYLPKFNQISQTATPSIPPDGDDRQVVLGVFDGIIPCADCERIKMRLTLYQDPATQGAAGYTLDQVYVGKGDQTFTQQGGWDYLRGTPSDENATVYGLNLDKPKEEQMYFLKVGETEVRLLDGSMNEVQGPPEASYILKKTN